jgi:hypothetical protein
MSERAFRVWEGKEGRQVHRPRGRWKQGERRDNRDAVRNDEAFFCWLHAENVFFDGIFVLALCLLSFFAFNGLLGGLVVNPTRLCTSVSAFSFFFFSAFCILLSRYDSRMQVQDTTSSMKKRRSKSDFYKSLTFHSCPRRRLPKQKKVRHAAAGET